MGDSLFTTLFGQAQDFGPARAFYGTAFDAILAEQERGRELHELMRARRADMVDDCSSQVLNRA